MGTYKPRRHVLDPELDLPSYATYKSAPTTGRVVLPREFQIPYDYPLPWQPSNAAISPLNSEEPENRLVTRNHNRARCLDVDLDEDDGAYATYVPITYQLPPTDEVEKNYIKTRTMNEIEAKSEELKGDIGRSIRQLVRGSTHCHLCNVFKESENASKIANSALTEYHKLSQHYQPRIDPGWNFENEMSRLMRRPHLKPDVTELVHNEWQLTNPIRRVQYEINRKALDMDIDSKSVRSKEGPKWLTKTEFPVDEDEIPRNKFSRPVHFTHCTSTRAPSDHLLTRRFNRSLRSRD